MSLPEFSHKFGRFFRRRRIDVKSGSPLETCYTNNPRDDLDVPVEIIGKSPPVSHASGDGFSVGSSMKYEIVWRVVKAHLQPPQNLLHNPGQRHALYVVQMDKVVGVLLGSDEDLEWESRGERADGDEGFILEDDSFLRLDFLAYDVTEEAAFLEPVVVAGRVEFQRDGSRSYRCRYKLCMRM